MPIIKKYSKKYTKTFRRYKNSRRSKNSRRCKLSRKVQNIFTTRNKLNKLNKLQDGGSEHITGINKGREERKQESEQARYQELEQARSAALLGTQQQTQTSVPSSQPQNTVNIDLLKKIMLLWLKRQGK